MQSGHCKRPRPADGNFVSDWGPPMSRCDDDEGQITPVWSKETKDDQFQDVIELNVGDMVIFGTTFVVVGSIDGNLVSFNVGDDFPIKSKPKSR